MFTAELVIIVIIYMGQVYTFFDEATREQNWRLLPHVDGSLTVEAEWHVYASVN